MQKFIKKLNGYSGCKLDLMTDNNLLFVKKTSNVPQYNMRLKKQLKKQMNFISESIKAPKIYNYNYDENGLFYFDMEFISGKTLAEYTQDILITEIVDFIKCLFKTIYFTLEKPNPKAQSIFIKKIDDLKIKLNNRPYLENAFNILKNFEWSQIYKSPCHGDLTLENIIITYNKQIYLIDFLDSFYNSWMIDIAKLLQDLELRWSFRNIELTATQSLRIEIAKEALIEEILKLGNGKQKLFAIYHLLMLNILRIYPYTTDDKTLYFLNNAIKELILKIDKIQKGVIL